VATLGQLGKELPGVMAHDIPARWLHFHHISSLVLHRGMLKIYHRHCKVIIADFLEPLVVRIILSVAMEIMCLHKES
jgi:hypothetical protein